VPHKSQFTHDRFDPLPFETFAAALERSGRPEDAIDLRIRKRAREVAEYSRSKQVLYWFGRHFVSYGYQNYKAAEFLAALWALGVIFHLFGRRRTAVEIQRIELRALLARLSYSFFFSLDRLVPHLALDRRMDEYSTLEHWARFYFYVHRILGTIIFLYAIVGWTGVLLH